MVATLRAVFGWTCLVAEAGVLRGRRFGNLVLVASEPRGAGSRALTPGGAVRAGAPGGGPAGAGDSARVAQLTRAAAADPFPGRVLADDELDRWVAGAPVITDADARPSPAPPPDLFTP
jgi:hypothetical protein